MRCRNENWLGFGSDQDRLSRTNKKTGRPLDRMGSDAMIRGREFGNLQGTRKHYVYPH